MDPPGVFRENAVSNALDRAHALSVLILTYMDHFKHRSSKPLKECGMSFLLFAVETNAKAITCSITVQLERNMTINVSCDTIVV